MACSRLKFSVLPALFQWPSRKNRLLQSFPGIRPTFRGTLFCNRFKEYQIPGSVLSQLKPSLLRKLDLNQWLNATVHFDVFIPINFDNSSSHWTRTPRVTKVDCLGAPVHYKSVDLMVLSFTWLFLRHSCFGNRSVQFSSSILQFDFISFVFYTSVVTFRPYCSSSFPFLHSLYMQFVILRCIRFIHSSSFSLCSSYSPFIDGVRLHEVRISFLLRSCFILQSVVTFLFNKIRLLSPLQLVPVEQLGNQPITINKLRRP